MKKQIIRALCVVLVVVSIVLVIPVERTFASMINTSASLDWSQLNIFGITWISRNVSTDVSALNSASESQTFSDYQTGWISSSSAAAISNAASQGISIVDQSLSATSYASLTNIGWVNSSGSTVLTGSFMATASGWVVITIPYSVSVDLTASSGTEASAQGLSRVLISLSKTGGSTSTDSMELFSIVYNNDTFSQNQSGILGLMKLFYAGETGTFRAEVFTEANASNPVPLPGAIWLFAPGLACFIGLRRKYCN